MTPEERERANAFAHDADRRDFIAAHRLVRAMAASIIGAPPRTIVLRQRCDTCGGPHGRPTLPDHPGLHVSLSHAKGVVAACGDRPVGIDLERWNASQPDHSDLDFALAPAERKRLQSMAASGATPTPHHAAALAFLRLWVRKECLVKLGRITLDQLDSVDFSAFMQTESVAQAAVTHFAHQGLHYSEWLDPELRVVGAAVGDGLSISIRSVKAAARDSPGARRLRCPASRRCPIAALVVPHRIEPALRLLLGHAEPQGRIPLAELPDGLADVVALRGLDALHLVEMRREGRDRRLRRLDIRRAVERVRAAS